MKIKHYIITLAAFAVAAFTTTLHASGLPAPMPEFLSQEQLVKWSEEKTEEAAAADSASAIRDSQFFFTGKPYLEESGSYAFKFRQYDPKLKRWISGDPSGFPDGANNWLYLANAPVSDIDRDGLKKVMWVYLWDSDNETRQTLFAAEINGQLSELHGTLNHDDWWSRNMPWANPTHYLDDGDTLVFQSLRNVQGLSDLQADQIYVAAHGNMSMQNYFNVLDYTLGGVESTFSRSGAYIKGLNDAILSVHGCTAAGGLVNAAELTAPWVQPTKDFLYE